MKRLKKAILLPLRSVAYRWNRPKLYYWTEQGLYEMRNVHVMPGFYYRWMYQLSMRLIESGRFQRLADRAIHTIPYNLRFHMA
jgi:hypothetical protein